MLPSLLLPGYPSSNPILGGLASLLAGDDFEEVLWRRDMALPTNDAFLEASWEALGWLSWPSVEASGLMTQMAMVVTSLPVRKQKLSWGAPLPSDINEAWEQVLNGAYGGSL